MKKHRFILTYKLWHKENGAFGNEVIHISVRWAASFAAAEREHHKTCGLVRCKADIINILKMNP
jgi:hypothetical protein